MRSMFVRKRAGGDRMSLGERINVGVRRTDGGIFIPGLEAEQDGLQPFGWVNIAVYNKFGIKQYETQSRNLVVNVGKSDLLNVYFADGTQTAGSSWFMGLIVDTGFTGINATDTMSSHSGWSEFTTYSQTTRPVWGQAGPSSGVTTITNASPVTFDITGTANVKGGFVTSNSTKGGTTGKLWAAALFTAQVPVNNGDQMKITYSLSC